ncbi:MAG TPA: hypothetical protein VIF61_00380 [Methylocystis sp.]|jgi:hypothetical protein
MNLATETRLLAMQETIDGLLFLVADFERKLSNVIRPGTIESYDAQKDTAKLDVGFETHDVPSGMHGGRGADWSPFKDGQQVTMLCPGGDVANAFFIAGGFHNDNPQPSQSADEDIRARRGSGDQAVQLRTTDDEAGLDCKKHQTFVRAGKDIAELDNKKHKSAVRADKDGKVKLEVTAIDNLKIKIGDDWFYIRPEALQPTSE